MSNTETLKKYLLEKETAVTGIAAYTPGVEVNLRWGDAVPLWFLRKISSKPKYVLLSQPLRRHDQTEELIPETLCLGNDLRLFFEKLEKNVVIIISADMGHTHDKDGPYGFSEDAAPFDALMEEWAGTLDSKLLVKKAVPKLGKALCCGYIGFVMLQGLHVVVVTFVLNAGLRGSKNEIKMATGQWMNPALNG